MDILDWYIAMLHQLIGHDRTADYLGQPRGEKAQCRLCRESGAVVNTMHDTRDSAPDVTTKTR
jgi:hypothetical protein